MRVLTSTAQFALAPEHPKISQTATARDLELLLLLLLLRWASVVSNLSALATAGLCTKQRPSREGLITSPLLHGFQVQSTVWICRLL